ncbi:MAG: trigger factor [Oscillospiraceae bacterium]|nr:trigger factor [Oscillospiraceae bacterium]
MNVKSFEQKENNQAELVVEIETAAFNAAVDAVYKKSRGSISVPGFRKGKAPRKIIENLYGKNVFYSDALDEAAPAAWDFATKERDEKMVGYPSIEDVNVNEDLSAEITFVVDLYPEVKVGKYKGLSAPRPHDDVSEDDVTAEIDALRNRNASVEKTERPAEKGDTVVIDYDGYLDGVPFDGGHGEAHELTLGSNSFIVGFEEKLAGISAGEERDLDLKFPDAYHAEELAGKDVVFHVKANEVRAKLLPELDDEFAKDVSEFDTLGEYRADVRAKLQKERTAQADSAFESELLDIVSDGTEVEIPDSMIREETDRQLQRMSAQLTQYGITMQQYLQMSGSGEGAVRDSLKPQAEKQTKITLALSEIARLEGIEPTDDEIDALYAETAERYGTEIEEVRESVGRDNVIQDLKLRGAIKLIRESATATEPHDHDHSGHDHSDHDHGDHEHEEAPKKKASKPRTKKPAEPKVSAETPVAAEEPAAEKPAEKPKRAPRKKAESAE